MSYSALNQPCYMETTFYDWSKIYQSLMRYPLLPAIGSPTLHKPISPIATWGSRPIIEIISYGCSLVITQHKNQVSTITFLGILTHWLLVRLDNVLLLQKFTRQINDFRPSNPRPIWHDTTASTLSQVMACCLMAPSHFVDQCCLLTSEVQWH